MMPQFNGQQPLPLPQNPQPQGGNPSAEERHLLETMFSQAGLGMNPGMSQMGIEQLMMLIQGGGPEALAAQQVLNQIMQQMQMQQQQGMPPQQQMPPQQGMPAPGGYQ